MGGNARNRSQINPDLHCPATASYRDLKPRKETHVADTDLPNHVLVVCMTNCVGGYRNPLVTTRAPGI